MNTPSLVIRRLLAGLVIAVAMASAYSATPTAQIPSRNVNMVSGLEYPGGDPFMQRQNEPSIAASTRNPLHLLAGSNDYRSVDFPIALSDNDGEIGDAWLGKYTSRDGGERWQSTLLPGHPWDNSPEGLASPLRGYHAGADPVVRAGTHGLMYYAGLVFDRSADPAVPGKSAIFVARFIDNNNQEAADPFKYVGTSIVLSNPGGPTKVFLDKPWMTVDIPRGSGGTCAITTNNEDGPFTQRPASGNVYVAFTVRSEDSQGERWDVYLSRSTDCGERFSAPIRVSRASDRVNQGASIIIAPNTGNVFVAWRRIDLLPDGFEDHAILVARSTDQGQRWDPPGVARRFPRGRKKGHDPSHFKNNGQGNSVNNGVSQVDAVELAPFDQGTSALDIAFRTNAYPTMAADGNGRLYLAWAERGFALHPDRQDPLAGDSRIMLSTSSDGATWSPPGRVSDIGQQGHQLMPALSFAGGKLMLAYYDLQEDFSGVFTRFVDDRTAFLQTSPDRRHTIDIRVSMGTPGADPIFEQSQSVSQYMMGARSATGQREQLQKNPPNLKMFRLGTVPFIGDYIDIAPSPSFVPTAAGGWTYNTAAGLNPMVFHVAWTDNRDVRPPFDKDWTRYTPPFYSGTRPDPGAPIILCESGYAGSRNQNIYTARVTGGLVVGSPQNSKQLNTTFQRAFVVFAKNTTNTQKYFRMTILNQPAGGRASFSQFPAPPFTPTSDPPLTVLDVTTPLYSQATRTVYVTSSDPHAQVTVDVSEISGVGAPGELPGGLEGAIVLNLDITNPEVDNPEVDNPEVDNPEVDNAEVYNPEVDNPEVDNPEVDNPEVDNPEVDNPEVDNIVVGNPEVDNPEVDNPEVDNPEVDNPEVDNPEVDNQAVVDGGGIITDITWKVRNNGNTTTGLNVNLFLRQNTVPSTGSGQLLIYKVYKTPIIQVQSCNVQTVTQNALVANIPSPTLVFPNGEAADPNDPGENSATMFIEPGGEIRVTLRVSDPSVANNVIVDGASIDPEWIPEQDVSLFVQPQPVNTPDVANGVVEPPLVGADPNPVLTVTSIADSGPGSLREAMTLANAQPGLDTIAFNIPGPGPHVILPATNLPNMTGPVIIDGSTQPGYAGVPLVEIDGNDQSGAAIDLHGGGSTVRGLSITRFGDEAIDMEFFGGNGVFGNYIGVGADGTSKGNGTGGIDISDNSHNNTIGGLNPLDRNVISGNAFFGVSTLSDGNRIEGNYIGLNPAGNAPFPQLIGVLLSGADGNDNFVGGNVISGNLASGVAVDTFGSTIEGNRIGTSADGLAAVANGIGVRIANGTNTRVIGNLISANSAEGVLVTRDTANPAGTEVSGNLIGTNATGLIGLGNLIGVRLEGTTGVVIGGVGAARNVISGNVEDGIRIQRNSLGVPSAATIIKGNRIGVNEPGTGLVSNNLNGILVLDSSDTVIGGSLPGEGNVISGNGQGGILINAEAASADNTIIVGNIVGLNASGNGSIANLGTGIRVLAVTGGGFNANNTRIGGPSVADRNIISGNSLHGILLLTAAGATVTGTTIQNNYVGVGANGLTNWGNGGSGIRLVGAPNTTIGGSQATAGNVVAGNAFSGILVGDSPNAIVAGNFVGVGDDGATAVPNFQNGVFINGSSTNAVVGGAAGFGNVISGNNGVGLNLSANGTTVTNNYIGTNASGSAAVANTTAGVDSFGNGSLIGQAGNGNLVSGNTFSGIRIRGWSTIVQGNKVGTDVTGTVAVPNGAGVVTQNRPDVIVDAVIGGAGPSEGNLISGNFGPGIGLFQDIVNPEVLNPEVGNPPPWFVDVKGNIVGTAINGIDAMGNGHHGFSAASIATAVVGGDTLQARNVFAYNAFGGIAVVDDASVRIEYNEIFSHAALSIDLGNDGPTPNDPLDADVGPNLRQNHPQLSAIVGPGEVNGELFAAPNSNYFIRVYSNLISGEPRVFQGIVPVLTDAAGHAFFTLPGLSLINGHWVMATATDILGNTSELSPSVQVNVP